MGYDVTKTNRIPMRVLFNDVELGLCNEGEITVSFAQDWVEQMAHQMGKRVLEAYYNPGNPSITCGLLEVETLSNWEIAFPGGSPQQDGSANTRFSPTLITAGTSTPHIGQKASAYAKRLVLRPMKSASSSTEHSFDVWFPLAYVRSVGDMNFGVDSAIVLDLNFGTLYNPSATLGEHIWIKGLKTAGSGTWTDA